VTDERVEQAIDFSTGGGKAEAHPAEPWLAERVPHWDDDRWWQAQIDAAVAGTDPVICNLRITLTHQELSLALRRILGPGSGANFHTWAVWGSKTAGRTIRQEDLPYLLRGALGAGTVLGASCTAALAHASFNRRVGLSFAAGATVGVTLNRAARALLDRATDRIFGGNATVLTDIGRQTARFVSAFSHPDDRKEDRLEEFLARLRPGPAASGGQDLLHGAYCHYHAAICEADPDRRDEQMLCGNLLAIRHEHERLDPYIDTSVPHPLRQIVTKHLLSFAVGAEAMNVGGDVPSLGPAQFPETLQTIESPELDELLCGPHGWDRTPNTVAGSAARDWTNLSDRMNFIVDLFRSRQTDPNLFTSPYSAEQREMILAGHVPVGPL
jgi:hypothetical protein